jgi:hypothetical protein
MSSLMKPDKRDLSQVLPVLYQVLESTNRVAVTSDEIEVEAILSGLRFRSLPIDRISSPIGNALSQPRTDVPSIRTRVFSSTDLHFRGVTSTISEQGRSNPFFRSA